MNKYHPAAVQSMARIALQAKTEQPFKWQLLIIKIRMADQKIFRADGVIEARIRELAFNGGV